MVAPVTLTSPMEVWCAAVMDSLPLSHLKEQDQTQRESMSLPISCVQEVSMALATLHYVSNSLCFVIVE
jgi:hypothetical protein